MCRFVGLGQRRPDLLMPSPLLAGLPGICGGQTRLKGFVVSNSSIFPQREDDGEAVQPEQVCFCLAAG